MSASVSTHVLDTARGQPAAGVHVSLHQGDRQVGEGVTGGDGRIAELAGSGVPTGAYTLTFDVGTYFRDAEHLWERISLELRLDEDRHYHLPLLLSPFSVAGYRGS